MPYWPSTPVYKYTELSPVINPPVIEPRSAEEVKDILKSAATKAEA